MPVVTDPQQLLRILDARYEDGVSDLVDGADAVAVAQTVFSQTGDHTDPSGLSTLFVSWGQFTDHDLSLTRDATGEFVQVPGLAGPLDRSNFDPATGTGTDNPRDQVNEITPEMDGSQIYGSTEARTDALRTFQGGKLGMTADGLLDDAAPGQMAGDSDTLFLAGDIRANENTGLTVLHTLFSREHNYWADRLAAADPTLDDDALFLAARSIVEAIVQKITYQEWLPKLIGDATDGVTVAPDASGQVTTEFSTAAFRFGHTMVSTEIASVAEDGTDTGALSVRDQFFNIDVFKDGRFADLMRGQAATKAQALDTQVIDDLNFFLVLGNGLTGFSLPALNIVRGRDHGLESYINVRAEVVGDVDPAAIDPTDFSVITSDATVQAQLAAVYDTVADVDLWVGGLAEDKVPGTQMGVTFTAIIADQFARTKATDDTYGVLDANVPADIAAEVADMTLADVITRVGDTETIQSDPFQAMNRISADPGDRRTTGTKEADLIIGTDTNDDLRGWNGDDSLHGKLGTDFLRGQRGNDELFGGEGNDRLFGGWDDDLLDGGADDDIIRGGKGEDTIYGGDGDDRIRGNDGDDLIDGGAGRDRLVGDEGSDTFVFATGYGRDFIKDFEVGIDLLDVSGLGITTLDEIEASARQAGSWLFLDFGTDEILLKRVDVDDLDTMDFVFA